MIQLGEFIKLAHAFTLHQFLTVVRESQEFLFDSEAGVGIEPTVAQLMRLASYRYLHPDIPIQLYLHAQQDSNPRQSGWSRSF